MLQVSSVMNRGQATRQTNYILIVEDNSRLRSVMARYIMIHCEAAQQSCALYHIGTQGQARLNYFQHSDAAAPSQSEVLVPDFAVFEADSPRRALAWLKETPVKQLTIISDVMMPSDTQVGLPGMIEGLRQLQVAVNLIFVSSDPQNQVYVQSMLGYFQQVLFLVKGSTGWRRLPAALVQQGNRFNYQPLARSASAAAALERETRATQRPAVRPAEVKNVRLSPAPVPTRQLYPAVAGMGVSSRLVSVGLGANQKTGGMWSRVWAWLGGGSR